ncbi:MAG: hypothetical protein PF795_13450 [Kiritimatiellae bacterium]|nr:hypothetical protein [Kiritimatiellia bacterium]
MKVSRLKQYLLVTAFGLVGFRVMEYLFPFYLHVLWSLDLNGIDAYFDGYDVVLSGLPFILIYNAIIFLPVRRPWVALIHVSVLSFSAIMLFRV